MPEKVELPNHMKRRLDILASSVGMVLTQLTSTFPKFLSLKKVNQIRCVGGEEEGCRGNEQKLEGVKVSKFSGHGARVKVWGEVSVL